MRLPLLLAAAAALATPARADTHTVTIRNGAGETISAIYFDGGTSSRLMHDLPQGAVARITYSTRCRTDIRIAFSSGRTEDHPGIDACSDPQLTAGTDGSPGPAMAASPTRSGTPRPTATAAAAATPAKAPPPDVPPWTGKSITKRFGGLD